MLIAGMIDPWLAKCRGRLKGISVSGFGGGLESEAASNPGKSTARIG